MKYLICFGLILSTIATSFSQEILYENHIQPIIREHCIKCHHYGGIAPMPFTDHGEVASYGKMIKYVTGTRYMPPWPASTPDVDYINQNQLSNEEIELISSWVDQGMPGSRQSRPDSMGNVHTHLKNYDVEIGMEESFEQYDIYFDQFHVFVIPFDIGRDTFVEAIEFVPGDESIVRSCHISITTSPAILEKDAWDPRYGYHSFGGTDFPAEWSHWHHWNAGDRIFRSESYTKFLPAKGYFLFHMHYGPTSEKTYDQSKLRIKFADSVKPVIQTIPLINQNQLTIQPFSIPKDKKKNVHAKTVLPRDLSIHGLFPQSNLICKLWQVYARIPGDPIPVQLLDIKEWDFKWRRNYQFEVPIFLPKGTEIHAFAQYDNTSENFSLPDDEAIRMKWGDLMFEETFIVHFMISRPINDKEMPPFSKDLKLLPLPTYITNGQLDLKLNAPVPDGIRIEFLHWDLDHVDKFEASPGQVIQHLNLSALPSGNYILSLKDKANAVVDHTYLSVEN